MQTRTRYLASERARKDDTRREILLGSVMLEAMQEDLDEAGRQVIHELLDRRLIGLPPQACYISGPIAPGQEARPLS